MNWRALYRQRQVKRNKFSMLLGPSMSIYGNLTVFVGAVRFLMTFTIFYAIVKGTQELQWINIPTFVIALTVATLIVAVVVWHVIIPHGTAFSNWIGYRHDNLLAKDHTELAQSLSEQGKDIKKIKEALNIK